MVAVQRCEHIEHDCRDQGEELDDIVIEVSTPMVVHG
jgi:hypothetical protein